MKSGESILWKVWESLTSSSFWVEASQRLVLLVALLVAAKILVAVMRRLLAAILRGRVRDQRTTTLAAMVQDIIGYALFFVALLVGLYVLGVPTVHLLTGLGIGGFALALGMQNLVRDMVSGVALLMENAMAVGDQVILNSSPVRGRVIEMGARVVKLRGEQGELHQMAYSTIQSITNLGRKAEGERKTED